MATKILKTIKFPNLPDTYEIPQGDVTSAMLANAEGTKADAIVLSASGEIASYDDGGDLPMKSLKVNIVPKQSGTGDPSPQNIRPISGTDEVEVNVHSKNFLRKLTVADFANATEYGLSSYIGIPLEKGTYTISTNAPTGYIWAGLDIGGYVRVFDGTPKTVVLDSDGTILLGVVTDNKAAALSYNIQIELGATATDYTPYNPISYSKSITLPQTVYGGTLDVVSGEGDSDRAVVDGGDLNWSFWTSNTYITTVTNKTAKTIDDIQCEIYPTKSVFDATPPNGIMCNVSSEGVKSIIYITDSTVADATALKAKLTGHKICYRVKTPTTVQLTPTEVKSLLGDNNVWSDSGTVEVEYRADTSIVINKILEALA